MVGQWRQCDPHYQTPPLWKDVKYEYDRAVFSLKYANRGDLFEGLAIWEEEEYWKIQGTYPVISLSFANLKERDYHTTRRKICQMMADLYADHTFLLESEVMEESDRESGFGRYDVMLEPKDPAQDRAFILEFKVFNSRREKSLEDTVASALEQIDKKQYEADLVASSMRQILWQEESRQRKSVNMGLPLKERKY